MFLISTILYAAEILGLCSALPIPSNPIGMNNSFFPVNFYELIKKYLSKLQKRID